MNLSDDEELKIASDYNAHGKAWCPRCKEPLEVRRVNDIERTFSLLYRCPNACIPSGSTCLNPEWSDSEGEQMMRQYKAKQTVTCPTDGAEVRVAEVPTRTGKTVTIGCPRCNKRIQYESTRDSKG